MEIIEKEGIRRIYADKDKYLTKDGQTYFKEGIMFPDETESDYTEVDEMPVVDYGYNERVNNLIRQRFSESDELAILRQRDTKPEEFDAYYDYAEECKLLAKEIK